MSALGDATHALPLVRTLQRAWPELPITWILGKGEAKLLEGLEGVELLVFDKKDASGMLDRKVVSAFGLGGILNGAVGGVRHMRIMAAAGRMG